MQNIDKVIELIKKTVSENKSWEGYTDHEDLFGVNADDTYDWGERDGRVGFANTLLEILEGRDEAK